MNIIQEQADYFYSGSEHSSGYGHYKPFVNEVKEALREYRKVAHKIEFLDTIINKLKQEYDEHLPICESPKTCGKNKFYSNSLFFLQEEVEDLEQQIPHTEFNSVQKRETLLILDRFVDDLNKLKIGQQITYDDLMQEFKDLRDFLYLDKANFTQLLLGKVTEMTAGGIVSETLSKSLLEMIKEHYPTLINFKF